jgi:DNA-binding NarL/FixJ family response regulator
MRMEVVKLLIVEDHKLIRNGVKLMLSNQSIYRFDFTEVSTGEEAIKLLGEESFDFVLLDITLSTKISGFEVLKFIKRKKLEVPVLIQSMHDEVDIIRKTFELGAKGYISKSSERDELVNAIRSIFAGQRYMSNEVSLLFSNDIANNISSKAKNGLTMRQIEILKSLAKGKTNKELSEIYLLSVRTIEGHRSRIMKKLNLSSTAEMIRYVYDNKL